MLESISCQYEDVRALLLERGEEGRLNDLSEDTLNAMVMFLQRFKEATKALEASKTPTLHLTAVWLDRLKRHLQPSSTDNLTFSSLKAKCLRILVEKYEIHHLHKLAMFLHPNLKSLKLLVEEHSMETVHNEVST
ncbi:Zinc finger protein 618 [Dissostichus eleginoides]|uniref:Zinc finger protein 618 n=1 Tax=Dissostichus eleginoides TaxID=100907 RepID=A0AAD9BZJ3_DISEL|nr:Zinc finger protein 618 [Dissostichus eleginoides]